MEFVLSVVGLAILLLAGDALVRGAVNLALRIGIPALIVSLTIVAFGTSAPELIISIGAILDGSSGIALGNVVGSNIANILLVLGVPAIISGIAMRDNDTRRSYVMMLTVSVLFVALAFWGPITWTHGLILLACLALVLFDQARGALADRRKGRETSEEEPEGADPTMPGWKVTMFLVLGLLGLPLGADLLIRGATTIARDFGISDAVIGLTLVAIGTSLPELATTVMAAIRKQSDVVMGNVIGSNIFNLLAIIGITSLIGPVTVDPAFLQLDFWVMLGAALLLAPFVFLGWSLSRLVGIAFCALYVGYLALLVT
ncbi:cation:H+ antiporter [Palleronia aestuarii]|uniref:Cation:H+ antiporter n=1 Tax=Palleronia aestuarii TaxID=568105 RepID=A0A2W7NCF7_9RHOB|nr:calcium/sodium antiporter [Palleronia aestuarii]PZX15837.1 cation:H+ antiporter [Palleronia aestuarii]